MAGVLRRSLYLGLLVLFPTALAAQVEVVQPSPGDTVPADTAARDTTAGRPPIQLDASADSVFRLLRELSGFTVTEYEGETAVYRAGEGVLQLEGEAAVSREGERLTADTIIFREREDLVEAYGGPRVEGEGQPTLDGRVLYYDLARRRATALGARTEVTQGATWIITGDMTAEGDTRLAVREGHFTSCDLLIPHYHFATDQIVVIRDKILVGRPAVLYFGDVPVMWLPFVVQNLERGRRSGLLTPRFGVHDIVRTSSGYNRQISDVGFYWAINDYLGAQLSATWRSGAYTALLGTTNFNWRRQFLNGTVTAERYWQEAGARQLGLSAQSSWQPDEATSVSLSGRYASSTTFVREASYDPSEVTQDINSSLSMTRRFSWGQLSLGGDRRQSISNGDVSMTLPTFNLSRRAITLFPAASPETARWYNGITINPGSIAGSRSTSDYADNVLSRRQDQDVTRLRVGPSMTIGNLSLGAGGDLNQIRVREVSGIDPANEPFELPGYGRDDANWSASIGYRQSLIGSTSISPGISFNQTLRRDTLTEGNYVAAPLRMSFGASLNTDLYGFFPGFAGFSTIRHRASPQISYSYAPEVRQTALQEQIYGRSGGRAQNRISLGVNQTWEAKLRTPRAPEEPTVPQDSLSGDTIPQARIPSIPSDPEKVTLLSLTTSAFEYDFVRAREEGSGFTTEQVSNTIRSDYLRGLTINTRHELFDRSAINPSEPGNVGRLGRFAPRLASLSTSFELGPQSALFQWLDRFAFGGAREEERPSTLLPGTPPAADPAPAGQGAFTGNPQGTGGGPWRVGLAYQFSRPPRIFSTSGLLNDEAIQTVDGSMSFQLSPNWSVNWNTSYSLTDGEFGAHRLNFQRDIHEWQANFNFYQTPNGNTAFEFYVQLLHNTDLRFDYAERNLGVDRRRR